ncbi:MAG: hypothetical protein KKF20_05790 [Bacteroidetes bacterium]|nr:hypothetical protein [Bacteroidota bacterium]
MKKFTHAWLAFRVIKRLEETGFTKVEDKNVVKALIKFYKDHKDDVLQGAWYPDDVIKDMASSHVLKISPSSEGQYQFRLLPSTSLLLKHGKKSPLYKKPFTVNKDDNLPNRCEALSHSIVDNLKIQQSEDKGSPVSPSSNHIALRMFMLSHYIADAHMPLHCDARDFSKGFKLHEVIEESWDKAIKKHFQIDKDNERFFYDPDGYPLRDMKADSDYQASFLRKVDDELAKRDFIIGYGESNNNVLDFMKIAAFFDAIDSIARIWFRVWRRYLEWKKQNIGVRQQTDGFMD